MLSDTMTQSPAEASPRLARMREAVCHAMDAVSGNPEEPRTERGARMAAAREAVVAYTRWMRDQGVPALTVIQHVKALVRGASGASSRGAKALRDALSQWTIAAYFQAD
jgi:hypothetical protein